MAQKQIAKVTSKYREIMRRIVCGQSPAQIKREIRMSDTHYSVITHSKLFEDELKGMEDEIKERMVASLSELRTVDPVSKIINDAAVEAANTDVDLMRSGSEKVKQASAWDILDRAGYKPKEHFSAEGSFEIKGKIMENIQKALEDIKVIPKTGEKRDEDAPTRE